MLPARNVVMKHPPLKLKGAVSSLPEQPLQLPASSHPGQGGLMEEINNNNNNNNNNNTYVFYRRGSKAIFLPEERKSGESQQIQGPQKR